MDFGAAMEMSCLQKRRSSSLPELPHCLKGTDVEIEIGEATTVSDPVDAQSIKRCFPLTCGQPLLHFVNSLSRTTISSQRKEKPAVKVGVVFAGRQSPGGHNVVCGLYDAMKSHNADSSLIGFCGGTTGLFAQSFLHITENVIATYRNQGGFGMLGRTVDQIRTTQQVNAALAACQSLNLNGLVIIGGVTSNTDAAQLAETFAEANCLTKVIGVPVTINGDLKNQFVEANVGFDTVSKVNSELVSNLCTDALSAEKYYYFIRLMGRRASHITLECALQSHPNMVILSEEVTASKLTLFDITKRICDAVQARANQDKYHGVILLPEGLIESIPEAYALLQDIHVLLKKGTQTDQISTNLSPWASALFESMPIFIKRQLLLSPESDESAQLSQIETEKILAQLVETEMEKRTQNGTYKGKKFNAICHFFGYQARGSLPSKFDCEYANALGNAAYHLISAGANGYMATVTNLKHDVSQWRAGGAPFTAMMTVQRILRGPGSALVGKPSIHPVAVDLKGKPYELLLRDSERFLMDDLYANPGPIQYKGPGCDKKTISLSVEDQDYMGRLKELYACLNKVKSIVKPGCSQEILKVALSSMTSMVDILSVMSPDTNNKHL
ncbi:Pyrophosphate--fructose 6-phosphate 1-phosphotransferase subunit alpha [Platanthera zijinensis]|uniref:Pyrophosphate--fructose 6-phosphate 1-phosphotransferase subunit alpha n=1 Tax=Platanthera zijinensis TaxID=2320716 RepID=A0AAP0BB69_9ASPA